MVKLANYFYFVDQDKVSVYSFNALSVKIQNTIQFKYENMLSMTHQRTSILLLWIPVIVMITAIAFATQMYPIYANAWFYGQDPAYQYLFAGVDILQGNAPAHNDHPGTPLQTLIAVTIAVVWFVQHSVGMTPHEMFVSVLATPETYLLSVSAIVILLNTFAIFFLGRQMFQATKSLLAAWICQLTPLLFGLVSPNLLYPSPESLLWCLSLCLFAVLTPSLVGDRLKAGPVKSKVALLAGVLCGMGLAVKVTFLPLVGLLIVLGSWRLIALSFAALMFSWFVGVLPIYKRLGAMFEWFYKVFSHSGLHGAGQNTMFNADQLVQNFTYVRNMYPLLEYAVWLMLAVGLYRMTKTLMGLADFGAQRAKFGSDLPQRTQHTSWTPLVSLSLVAVAQATMVAKHPGPTYMIPALPIAPIAAILAIETLKFIKGSVTFKFGMQALLLAFAGYLAVTSSIGAYRAIGAHHMRGTQANQLVQNEINKYSNPVLIGTFNCTLPLCALWFGQLMAPGMGLKMEDITKDFYHFDIFSKSLQAPGKGSLSEKDTELTLANLLDAERTVLLISPPYEQLANFELEKLVTTPVQDLYRVKRFTPGQAGKQQP